VSAAAERWLQPGALENASSEDCAALVRALRDDAAHLAAARNPLGFIHVTLAQRPDASLRLHLWPRERAPQDEALMIHDHAFALTSRVLAGTITNVDYDVLSAPHSELYLLAAQYVGDQSRLQPTDERVALRRVGHASFGRGEVYALPARSFHETVVAHGTLAATLFRIHYVSSAPPRVVAAQADVHAFTRAALTGDELTAALDELLAAM
jgi:hypothetical protein